MSWEMSQSGAINLTFSESDLERWRHDVELVAEGLPSIGRVADLAAKATREFNRVRRRPSRGMRHLRREKARGRG